MAEVAGTRRKNKPGAGRPGWEPTPEILDQIEALATRGMQARQICHFLKFNETYFYGEILKKFPEISERIKQGKAKGTTRVLQIVWDKIEKGEDKWLEYFLNHIAGFNPNKGLVQISNTSLAIHEDNSTTNVQINFGDITQSELKTLVTQSMLQLESKNKPTTRETTNDE